MVGVAVCALQQAAVRVRNPLDRSCNCLEIEGSGGPDRDATGMDAGLLSIANDRTDTIARLEAMETLLSGEIAAWESMGRHAGSLVAASSARRDGQHWELPVLDGGDYAGAEGVEGVGLWESEARAVPLGPATTTRA